MTLLAALLEILAEWRGAFPQKRTWKRGARQAVGCLVCLGRRTLTRIIWTNGGQNRSWSSEYFLHSRCKWVPQELFAPLLRRGLTHCSGQLIGMAIDATHVRKTGRLIPQAFLQRDPLSPPFHVNLVLGLRFLQASLLIPLYRRAPVNSRGIPVAFEEVSAVKRPKKNADPEQWQAYRQAVRTQNLSQHAAGMMKRLREAMDAAGAAAKTLVFAGDGSFANRACLTAEIERTELVVRARKDAKLCRRAPANQRRRFYDRDKFTPEQVRTDETVAYTKRKFFYGGKRRKGRYKEVGPVYWQGGARRRPLRLIVLAPTPYRKRLSGRLYYRQPAYLLTTDLRSPAHKLVQIYLDRWQIEVNHREEKDTLGVGQAQLWNPISVPKQPALTVAAYSALILASLQVFGAQRGQAYAPLPRWRPRSSATRPSCLDLITLLRQEMTLKPELVASLDITFTDREAVAAAAA